VTYREEGRKRVREGNHKKAREGIGNFPEQRLQKKKNSTGRGRKKIAGKIRKSEGGGNLPRTCAEENSNGRFEAVGLKRGSGKENPAGGDKIVNQKRAVALGSAPKRSQMNPGERSNQENQRYLQKIQPLINRDKITWYQIGGGGVGCSTKTCQPGPSKKKRMEQVKSNTEREKRIYRKGKQLPGAMHQREVKVEEVLGKRGKGMGQNPRTGASTKGRGKEREAREAS